MGRPLPHARLTLDEHGQLHVKGAVMSCYLGEQPELAVHRMKTLLALHGIE